MYSYLLSPVVEVGYELLAVVLALALVVADKDGDGVDWQSSQKCVASNNQDRRYFMLSKI